MGIVKSRHILDHWDHRDHRVKVRSNAAIAAQNRMQSQFKSPDEATPNKVTKQKEQMVKELDLIDQRQQEMDQMKQDRIKKGLSVH